MPGETAVPRTVTVNGEARHTVADTMAALVEELGLGARQLAAMRNGRIVRRAAWAAEPLAEGDTVELIAMVGGG